MNIIKYKDKIPKPLESLAKNIFYHLNNSFSIVEIETTSFCNRKCLYCPNSQYDRGKNYMSEELFKKIINNLKEINFKCVLHPHFYGEPLSDERLPKLLKYAKEQLPEVMVKIYSNGDYLNLDLYKKLIEIGVDEFDITEHSVNTKIKDALEYDKQNKILKIKYHKMHKVSN